MICDSSRGTQVSGLVRAGDKGGKTIGLAAGIRGRVEGEGFVRGGFFTISRERKSRRK